MPRTSVNYALFYKIQIYVDSILTVQNWLPVPSFGQKASGRDSQILEIMQEVNRQQVP